MTVQGALSHNFITLNYNRHALGLGGQSRYSAMQSSVFQRATSGPAVPRAFGNSNSNDLYANSYLLQKYGKYIDYSKSYSNSTKFDWGGHTMGALGGAAEGFAQGFANSKGDWKKGLIQGAIGLFSGFFNGRSKSA